MQSLLDDMELLLLEDITGVGKRNDIIVVGDGFALNCLLPQRKALVATPTVRKRYADQIKRRAEEREHDRKMQQEAADMILGKIVHFTRKVAKTDKLYAAITAKDISEALASEHSINVAPDDIQIADPIKSVGNVQVQVRMAGQMFPVQISVMREQTAPKAEPVEKKAA